jgi:cell division protein ZipA
MMDLTIRDWMVIVGVLLIVAVLLDAWRRVRSERYSRVRVKLADVAEGEADDSDSKDDDISMFKELPNGGARVVQRGDLLRAAGCTQPHEGAADADPGRGGPGGGEAGTPAAGDDELVAGVSSSEEPENLDWLDGMGAGEAAPRPERGAARPRRPPEGETEVFMLNVVSRSPHGFSGEDILHILLACDLRFGDMNFFHRHEFEAGRGAIQFSVANMMQPGVFDIDNMADLNTPGLVFFLTLPGPEDMMKAFDYMLETAQAVARNLGGDVLDESRSVLTRQALEHCRQRIRDLERRLLARAR